MRRDDPDDVLVENPGPTKLSTDSGTIMSAMSAIVGKDPREQNTADVVGDIREDLRAR
jgi:hypothetical protein